MHVRARSHHLAGGQGQGQKHALTSDGARGDGFSARGLQWAPDSSTLVAIKVAAPKRWPPRQLDLVEHFPDGHHEPRHSRRPYPKPGDPLPRPTLVLFRRHGRGSPKPMPQYSEGEGSPTDQRRLRVEASGGRIKPVDGQFAVLDLDSGSVGVDGGSRRASEQQKDEGAAEVEEEEVLGWERIAVAGRLFPGPSRSRVLAGPRQLRGPELDLSWGEQGSDDDDARGEGGETDDEGENEDEDEDEGKNKNKNKENKNNDKEQYKGQKQR